VTTNTGALCYDADFYPYGGERTYTNSCPTANNYKFEGKERDTETGNDDFGARYYSNRFGRWLSADWSSVPVAVPYANLANPQTLNLYAMVSDDPESFADLDGHDWDNIVASFTVRERSLRPYRIKVSPPETWVLGLPLPLRTSLLTPRRGKTGHPCIMSAEAVPPHLP
jgi:RHS repeat-associated protein